MNHMVVTHLCGRCGRASVVIIGGAHYCSSHGLDMTLHLAGSDVVVDLRQSMEQTELPTPTEALVS